MRISSFQLLELWVAAGAPPAALGLIGGGPFSMPDSGVQVVDRDFVQGSFEDLLDMLPAELVATRQAGGKTIRHLKHTMRNGDTTNEAGDCDSGSVLLMAHAIVGNWLKAEKDKQSRGGVGLGFVDYVVSQPGDLFRGPHSRNWFVEPDPHTGFKLGFFEVFWNAFMPAPTWQEMQTIKGGRFA